MKNGQPRLIEPTVVDDELCTDLVLIEDLEFGARFVLASRQTVVESGDVALVVKRKIVLSDAAIGRALQMTLLWAGRRTVRFAREALVWPVK